MLKRILDALFAAVPYTQNSQQAKARIGQAMSGDYDRLIGEGKNEMQAVGEVMCRYDTPEDAARLAGVAPEALESPAENATFPKGIARAFARVRFWTLLASVFCYGALNNLILGVGLFKPWYLVLAIVGGAIAYLMLLPCRKTWKAFDYDKVVLPPRDRDRFILYLDRFQKRTVNSFLLFVALAAYFVSATLERYHLSGQGVAELLAWFTDYHFVLQIGGAICVKNILNTAFLCRAVDAESRRKTRKYLGVCGGVCLAFLAVSIPATLLLRAVMGNPFILFYALVCVFIGVFALVNYEKRAGLMAQNLRVNKQRLTAFGLAALIALGVTYMKADRWILQPYIMTVSAVPHAEREIAYDHETGVYTIYAGEEDFKILHLTDIHLGGSAFSSYKDLKALDACYRLIKHTQPDFVVVTGDMVFPLGIMSLSLNNEAPVMQFANFMRNVGIPWAFTYGNHDTESMASGSRAEIGALYESLSMARGGGLLYPVSQPDISGRSNQMIEIVNPDGSVRQALFLIDSNDYTGLGVNDYDYIHDDQVDWYADQVRALPEGTKSMLFFHIPLQEYREANALYEQGSSEVEYHFGIIGETMIDAICASDYPSRLFDVAEELGSTQAMFCGHDHYNNISLTYRGIRLTYGMSIDYLAMPGIDKDTAQRGGELITLHPDGTYALEQIPLTSLPGLNLP